MEYYGAINHISKEKLTIFKILTMLFFFLTEVLKWYKTAFVIRAEWKDIN